MSGIVTATALLSSTLPTPVPGFAPLWFRNEIIGAIGRHWLPRLPPDLFKVADEGTPPAPAVRVRGVDRRGEPGLIPLDTLNRWLAEWAERLHQDGLLPGWRGERVHLYGAAETEPLLTVERGLLRPLGLLLRSVQVNVFTLEKSQLRIWVARRADSKAVDPGCYDTLVGGGIAGDETPLETLVRECQEEAGIGRALARRAVPIGVIDSTAQVVDGAVTVLHRERLMLYDLKVPVSFQPALVDGESQSARYLSPDAVVQSIKVNPWTREGAWATTDLIRRQLQKG
ncbi:MAG: NUDIX domain-containing protein [Lautropia sp.]